MRLPIVSSRRGAVLAVVSALALAACGEAPQPPVTGAQGTPQVSVVTVQPQRLALTTELPGRVAPALIAEVRPQITGLVLQRRFKDQWPTNCHGLGAAPPDRPPRPSG